MCGYACACVYSLSVCCYIDTLWLALTSWASSGLCTPLPGALAQASLWREVGTLFSDSRHHSRDVWPTQACPFVTNCLEVLDGHGQCGG